MISPIPKRRIVCEWYIFTPFNILLKYGKLTALINDLPDYADLFAYTIISFPLKNKAEEWSLYLRLCDVSMANSPFSCFGERIEKPCSFPAYYLS